MNNSHTPGADAERELSLPLSAIYKICMGQWINRTGGNLNDRELAHNAAISRCLGMLKARAATPAGASVAANLLTVHTAALKVIHALDTARAGTTIESARIAPQLLNLRLALVEVDRARLAAGAPAETVKAQRLISSEANWPDEKIIEVLHSCGVDTYPSKFGFSAVQVSATSIPTLRAVLEILSTPQIDATTAPASQAVSSEAVEEVTTHDKMDYAVFEWANKHNIRLPNGAYRDLVRLATNAAAQANTPAKKAVRPPRKASADFDLPAPNDAIQVCQCANPAPGCGVNGNGLACDFSTPATPSADVVKDAKEPRKMQVDKSRMRLCANCVHESVAGDTFPCNCCWNPVGDMYKRKPAAMLAPANSEKPNE